MKWLRWVALAVVLAATGLFAFQLGVEDERGRSQRQAQEVDQLRQANQRLEASVQQLQADNKTTLSQLAELGDRMASETVPGVSRDLLMSLKQTLDSGVEAQRIASAIAALAPQPSRPAGEPQVSALPKPGPGEECEPAETKKFLVRTPISGDQPGMSVGFGAGVLTVSAQGVAARNADRKAEAWFEPKEPVTIRFAQTGGKSSEASGKLPLQHNITIGPLKYRFLLAEGARGFIQVTADRCKGR